MQFSEETKSDTLRIKERQLALYPENSFLYFPTTRYQGSKLKILDWIWESIKHIDFETALDAFGGTGCVGYMFKCKGKEVTYNDVLTFNYYIGLALIENNQLNLTKEEICYLITRHDEFHYDDFITKTFRDIYFMDEENFWLDVVVQNIQTLENKYERALAFFALFQACIIKRPYNLFHRKNLYMRTANVKRSFGNKATWDKSFQYYFKHFVTEANFCVFDNGKKCQALNEDALELKNTYDLVYIDTPYISAKGIGVDYLEFYHFLEGLANYKKWEDKINFNSKHKKFKAPKSIWADKNKIHKAFDDLFYHFKDSILVVSYRDYGIPIEEELFELLKRHKKNVYEVKKKNYKYALSKNDTHELLFIAT
ncbi:MAG: DNA adenine methylase [bacterium]